MWNPTPVHVGHMVYSGKTPKESYQNQVPNDLDKLFCPKRILDENALRAYFSSTYAARHCLFYL